MPTTFLTDILIVSIGALFFAALGYALAAGIYSARLRRHHIQTWTQAKAFFKPSADDLPTFPPNRLDNLDNIL